MDIEAKTGKRRAEIVTPISQAEGSVALLCTIFHIPLRDLVFCRKTIKSSYHLNDLYKETGANPNVILENSRVAADLTLLLGSDIENLQSATFDTSRIKRTIRLRFGLVEDGKIRRLHEIATEFGVTTERIRQLETTGLRMLRLPRVTRNLHAYVELLEESRPLSA